MLQLLRNIQKIIGSLSTLLLYVSMFCVLALILVTCAGVVGRYVFSFTVIWLDELRWHLFAVIFLAGSVYGLKENGHVRVDIFYSRFSPKVKASVDLVGTLLFLFPICYFICVSGYSYAIESFKISEVSGEPNGLAWRWLIKGAIPVFFFFLFLQGISFVCKQIEILFFVKKSEEG